MSTMSRNNNPDHDEELNRIRQSDAETSQALEQSLNRLNKVIQTSGKSYSAFTNNSNVSAVLKSLGQYGFELANSDVNMSRLRRAENVEECARLLGARTRQVILPTEWWKKDHGHMVGYLKDDSPYFEKFKSDGADKVAVALISKISGGYEISVEGQAATIPVDQKVADYIHPSALEVIPKLPDEVSGFRDIARYVLPMIRKELIWIAFIGGLLGFIGALFPIATGIIVDQLIPGLERNLLLHLGIALGVIAVLNYFLLLTKIRLNIRADGRTGLILQSAIWDRILKLPASFFKNYSSGDLRSRMDGIDTLRSTIITIVLSTSITFVFSIFYLVLLFYYDTRLALVAIAYVTILVLASIAIALYMKKYYKRQAEISGWLSGYVFQVLQAIVKLRTAAAEKRSLILWSDKFADLNAATMTTTRVSGLFAILMQLYTTLGMIILFAATFYLSGGSLSAGGFIAFLAAFAGFQTSFHGLSGALLGFVAILPEWERAKPLLTAETETKNGNSDPGALSGRIDLSGINFAYKEGVPVLKDINLSIQPGEHIAIVGPSGSGKSTLVRILLALETPQNGSVNYDNQALNKLDLTLVRRQIGVVTQNGKLTSGTIMDNIRGATALSHEDCLQACIAAGLEEDLKSFPMGIHTPMTDGATTLSGGQRQRLLIARALVNKPKILIFDEATSALDNKTQAIVTKSLERLKITRIVVAHRLSTIANADRIYVLENGEIVEQGTYQQLVENGQLFTKLVQRQII